MFSTKLTTLVLAAALVPASVHAAAIIPGDLLLYRASSTATLSTSAASVFLDEYTQSGTLVQSIAVSNSGSSALTVSGSANTEGIMSISGDGKLVVFGGYRANAGTATINTTTSTAVNRVIGYVGLDGNVNTSTAITDSTTDSIRSVGTVDGSSFYVGTASQLRYVSSAASTTSTQIEARNTRQALVVGNTVYTSSGSGSGGPKVFNYGLPTSSTAGTGIATFSTPADAAQGIFFADLNPAVPGVDTLYAIDANGPGLQKFSFDGTSWTLLSQLTALGTGAVDITGFVNPDGSVALYLTTATLLKKVTDTTGYGTAFNGTFASAGGATLATISGNNNFRGLAVIPEPATLSTLAGVGSLVVARRRKSI